MSKDTPKEISGSGSSKEVVPAAQRPSGGSSSSAAIAPWERGVRSAFRSYLYLAVPVLLWLVIGLLGVISEELFVQGNLIVSVIVFLLGIPFSIIFRMDEFAMRWGVDDAWLSLLVALLVVLLNFVSIGAIRGALRGEDGVPSGSSKPTRNKKKRQSE